MALNPFPISFLNFAKSVSKHAKTNSFSNYKHFIKLNLKVTLTGYTVTMETCYVMIMLIFRSTITGHLFNAITVALADKELKY